jgi:hypothetical protein
MKQRMLRGELYRFADPELAADYARAQALLERYNATGHDEQWICAKRSQDLFGEVERGRRFDHRSVATTAATLRSARAPSSTSTTA